MNDEPGFLDTEAAAAYIGIAHRTMIDWRRDGRGPAYIKTSRRAKVMYRRQVLDQYMDLHTVIPGTL